MDKRSGTCPDGTQGKEERRRPASGTPLTLSPKGGTLSLRIAPISLSFGDGFLGVVTFVGRERPPDIHLGLELTAGVATDVTLIVRVRLDKCALAGGFRWHLETPPLVVLN